MVKIQVNSQGKAYYTSTGKVLLAPEGSGAQVRAKNYTGSNILEGDKVWINRENGENKLVTFDNDVYNIASSNMHNVTSLSRYFTPVTNNAKYLSISSSSIPNFISSLFTSSSNDFELVVKFFVNSASEHSRIFSLQTDATPGSSFFTWCSLSEDSSSLKKISLGFSYAYNEWDGINLNTEIEDNTWYYLIYNRSSGKLSLSLAKNSLNNVIETVINSRDNVVFYCSSSYTYIALAQTNSGYIPLTYDLSEISFNSSYQNINWKALDLGNITADTQTGTAAENIASGATGLVNVGAVINPNSITATNNTGSTVNSGDKVWINENSNGHALVNYYSSVPNFDVIGSPTITNGVASGFSSSNYLRIPQIFNPGNNALEINLRFTTGSSISTNQCIFGQIDSFGSGKNSIYCLIYNDTNTDLILGLSSNGSSYDIANGLSLISSIQANTEYNVKITYDNTSNEYKFYVNNEQVGNAVSGNPIYNNSTLIFGNERAASSPFLGSIDLNETYIKIDGAGWWTPYATNVTSDTQTGIAAESITAGSAGLVNVASGVL